MTSTPAKKPKGPEDDIGTYANIAQEEASDVHMILQSDKVHIPNEIHGVIGSHQVSDHKLPFAPPWIIEQAFDKKHQSNLSDAYEPVPEKDVPRDANTITSHVTTWSKRTNKEIANSMHLSSRMETGT